MIPLKGPILIIPTFTLLINYYQRHLQDIFVFLTYYQWTFSVYFCGFMSHYWAGSFLSKQRRTHRIWPHKVKYSALCRLTYQSNTGIFPDDAFLLKQFSQHKEMFSKLYLHVTDFQLSHLFYKAIKSKAETTTC